MSGGPEFEPRGTRAEQPVRVASAPEPAKPSETSDAAELVTNVAVRAVPARVQPEPQVEGDAAVVLTQVAADPLPQISAFDDQGASFTLASLEDGVAGLRQIETEVLDDV